MSDANPDLPEGFEDLPASQQVRVARDKARHMLQRLLDAQAEAEQHARTEGHTLQPGHLTGRHAMEQAIASTRRMLDALEALAQDMPEDEQTT